MPLRELKGENIWKNGYSGIKHLYCKKTPHRISCDLIPSQPDQRVGNLVAVQLSIETTGATFDQSDCDVSIHFNDEEKCWMEDGVMKCIPDFDITERQYRMMELEYRDKVDNLVEAANNGYIPFESLEVERQEIHKEVFGW